MKRKWVPVGSRGSGNVRKEIGVGGYGRIVLLRDDSLSERLSAEINTQNLNRTHIHMPY